jgi:serine/threonine kinase PknH
MNEAPRPSRVLGSRFGPYRLKRLLGVGGMGEVYEAHHTVKDWPVALKLMSPHFSEVPEFRERMQREARITGQLREPHVVPIHDYGEIDGHLYLEMRLIQGKDLHTLLKKSGPLSPRRAVGIVHQIASALDAAHAADVLHRDVKPKNVLVTNSDFAYLVDFGIAKAATDAGLTKGGAVGSWHYMAPERLFGKAAVVTHRADIYSLACLLYESLTGSTPYAGTMTELASAHISQPIPRLSTAGSRIPKAFDAVIACGMAKSPDHRYASAGDLARAARQALQSDG